MNAKFPKLTAVVACLLSFVWAAPVSADQVIADDLIVDGSACVGFDCVNGESFGFDTLRLKENNLRIRAQDTSSTASFPTNDWQITFNDTTNGGQNKFSIDDVDGGRTPFTIEAGTRSHQLYVDSGGRVGFGTNTPVVDLHVKSGNTPTLRLEQDGSSGFTPQTWDVAGNEANFFIRDASNGSTLPFRIQPGAPSNAIHVLSSGNIGFGAASPAVGNGATRFNELKASGSAAIAVDAGANSFGEFLMEQDNVAQWSFGMGANDQRFYIFDYTGNTDALTIETANRRVGLQTRVPTADLQIGGGASGVTGSVSRINAGDTQFTAVSSRTVKENIKPVAANGILRKMSNVGVYTYDFIDGPKDKLGLIAEDFHEVFQRGSDKTVNGQEVQMALWLAVQELNAKVAYLEAQLEAKENDSQK